MVDSNKAWGLGACLGQEGWDLGADGVAKVMAMGKGVVEMGEWEVGGGAGVARERGMERVEAVIERVEGVEEAMVTGMERGRGRGVEEVGVGNVVVVVVVLWAVRVKHKIRVWVKNMPLCMVWAQRCAQTATAWLH